MTTKFKKSFSPMLICWNDIKIHLGFEDSYFVPPPSYMLGEGMRVGAITVLQMNSKSSSNFWQRFLPPLASVPTNNQYAVVPLSKN